MSPDLISDLLDGYDDIYAAMEMTPIVLDKNSDYQLRKTFTSFKKNNPLLDLDQNILCQPLSTEEQNLI